LLLLLQRHDKVPHSCLLLLLLPQLQVLLLLLGYSSILKPSHQGRCCCFTCT
jgi:hypothetical protein